MSYRDLIVVGPDGNLTSNRIMTTAPGEENPDKINSDTPDHLVPYKTSDKFVDLPDIVFLDKDTEVVISTYVKLETKETYICISFPDHPYSSLEIPMSLQTTNKLTDQLLYLKNLIEN